MLLSGFKPLVSTVALSYCYLNNVMPFRQLLSRYRYYCILYAIGYYIACYIGRCKFIV